MIHDPTEYCFSAILSGDAQAGAAGAAARRWWDFNLINTGNKSHGLLPEYTSGAGVDGNPVFPVLQERLKGPCYVIQLTRRSTNDTTLQMLQYRLQQW